MSSPWQPLQSAGLFFTEPSPRAHSPQLAARRVQYLLRQSLEAISKIGFWFKVKADARFKPEEYIKYFEDLNRASNAEIGQKDIFEIASIYYAVAYTNPAPHTFRPGMQGKGHD